jgi:hypothetical protein
LLKNLDDTQNQGDFPAAFQSQPLCIPISSRFEIDTRKDSSSGKSLKRQGLLVPIKLPT